MRVFLTTGFLNVVIHRVPRGGMRAFGARSVCPAFKQRIAWSDNLPILGWLRLRGKARCCGMRIAFRYPLVEGLTALAFALLCIAPPFGSGFRFPDVQATALLAFVFHAYFVSNLLANTFIDIDFRILPDVLTFQGMVVGLAGSLVVPGLVGTFTVDIPGQERASSFVFSAAGLALGVGATCMISSLQRKKGVHSLNANYTVALYDAEALAFYQEIGFRLPRKQAGQHRVSHRRMPNVAGIPYLDADLKRAQARIVAKMGKPQALKRNKSINSIFYTDLPGGRNISYSKLEELREYCRKNEVPCPELDALARAACSMIRSSKCLQGKRKFSIFRWLAVIPLVRMAL